MTAEDPSGRVSPIRRRWVDREFLKLWAGQTISELGSSITFLALPTAAVIGFHATAFQVGLLAATTRIPFPFLSLLAGVVVDRLPRRPILIVCDVGRCLVLASIPLAAILNLLSLPLLFVTAFVSGVLTVFFDVAYLSYVPLLAGRAQLSDANARLQMSVSLAQVAGPGLAGLLVQLLGAARAIAADSVSFVISALSLLWIRRREDRPDARGGPGVARELVDGLRFVSSHPILRAQIVIIAYTVIGGHLIDGVQYVFAYRDAHLTPGIFGVTVMLSSLGAFAGVAVVKPVTTRFGVGPSLAVGFAGFPVALAFLPLALVLPAAAVITVVFFVGVMTDTVANINQVTLRQSLTPDRYLGRMNSIFRTVVWGAIPLGSVVGGALASAFGAVATFEVGAAIGLTGAVALFISPIGQLREFPGPQ
ncbi:MAG TPA: MFS transporter [Candidatus Dormibacteraeota bacterium]|nr:MFS transporter [Candidatus Dormibacteraeota bacterium]